MLHQSSSTHVVPDKDKAGAEPSFAQHQHEAITSYSSPNPSIQMLAGYLSHMPTLQRQEAFQRSDLNNTEALQVIEAFNKRSSPPGGDGVVQRQPDAEPAIEQPISALAEGSPEAPPPIPPPPSDGDGAVQRQIGVGSETLAIPGEQASQAGNAPPLLDSLSNGGEHPESASEPSLDTLFNFSEVTKNPPDESIMQRDGPPPPSFNLDEFVNALESSLALDEGDSSPLDIFPPGWADLRADVDQNSIDAFDRYERAETGNFEDILQEVKVPLDNMPATSSQGQLIQKFDNSNYDTSGSRAGYSPQNTLVAGVSIPALDLSNARGIVNNTVNNTRVDVSTIAEGKDNALRSVAKHADTILRDRLTAQYNAELAKLSADSLGLPDIPKNAADAQAYLNKGDDEKWHLRQDCWRKFEKDATSFKTRVVFEELQTELAKIIATPQDHATIPDKIIKGPIAHANAVISGLLDPYKQMATDLAISITAEHSHHLHENFDEAASRLFKWIDYDYADRQTQRTEPQGEAISVDFAEAFGKMQTQIAAEILGDEKQLQGYNGEHKGKPTAFGSICRDIAKVAQSYKELLDMQSDKEIALAPVKNYYLDIFDSYCQIIIELDQTKSAAESYLNLVASNIYSIVDSDDQSHPGKDINGSEGFQLQANDFNMLLADAGQAMLTDFDTIQANFQAAVVATVRRKAQMLGDPLLEPHRSEIQDVVNDMATKVHEAITTKAENFSSQVETIPSTLSAQFEKKGDVISTLEASYYNVIESMRNSVTKFNIDSDSMYKNAKNYSEKVAANSDAAFQPLKDAFDKTIEATLEAEQTNLCNTLANHVTGVAPDILAQIPLTTTMRAEETAEHTPTRVQQILATLVKTIVTILVTAVAAAITLASAGSLGAVAGMLIGAGVHAIFGAAGDAFGQFISNLIMDRPMGEGVGSAAAAGAIGGLITGGVAGGVTKVLGNSSTARTFWQLVTGDTIDLGTSVGVNIIEQVVHQQIEQGRVLDWEQIGLGALIGLGVGAGSKLSTRAPLGYWKAKHKKPSPYNEPTPVAEFMDKFSFKGSAPKRNKNDFFKKFSEELNKKGNFMFPGTLKSRGEMTIKLSQFDAAGRRKLANKFNIAESELDDSSFKTGLKKLDSEGKEEVFKFLPESVQQVLERDRKNYQKLAFIMENKPFEALFVKEPMKYAMGGRSIWGNYNLRAPEPSETDESPVGAEIDDTEEWTKLPKFVGENQFEFKYSSSGVSHEAPEVKNLFKNEALIARYRYILDKYMKGEGKAQVDPSFYPYESSGKVGDKDNDFIYNRLTGSIEDQLTTSAYEDPTIDRDDVRVNRTGMIRAIGARHAMSFFDLIAYSDPSVDRTKVREYRHKVAQAIRSDNPELEEYGRQSVQDHIANVGFAKPDKQQSNYHGVWVHKPTIDYVGMVSVTIKPQPQYQNQNHSVVITWGNWRKQVGPMQIGPWGKTITFEKTDKDSKLIHIKVDKEAEVAFKEDSISGAEDVRAGWYELDFWTRERAIEYNRRFVWNSGG